jgi:hypothetical protein
MRVTYGDEFITGTVMGPVMLVALIAHHTPNLTSFKWHLVDKIFSAVQYLLICEFMYTSAIANRSNVYSTFVQYVSATRAGFGSLISL